MITSRLPRLGMLALDHGAKRAGNIGAAVIFAELHKGGYEIDWIAGADIDTVDILLVSLPSTYQVVDYVRLARRCRFDRRRRAKILVGGYGMQNPHAMIGYMDWGFFGRAHDIICDLVAALWRDGWWESRSLTGAIPDSLCEIRQAPLYDSSHVFREQFTGCNLKCKFCHYTYARRYTGGDDNPYVQTMLTDGGAPELLMFDLPKQDRKLGRLRTAMDGFSERLRNLYGKRISDHLIVESIHRLGELNAAASAPTLFEGGRGETTVMMVYNISNYPGETPDDEARFIELVRRLDPAGRVVVIVHTTPFRPSPATPMQWEPVSLSPQWSDSRQRVLVDMPNLLVKYSYTLEGMWSHLSSVVIERARERDVDMIHRLATATVGDSRSRADAFIDREDVSYHLSEHDIASRSPTWWLNGYIDLHLIRRIATKMRAQRLAW